MPEDGKFIGHCSKMLQKVEIKKKCVKGSSEHLEWSFEKFVEKILTKSGTFFAPFPTN